MKELLYLFFSLSIIFSACKKEDEDMPTPTVINGCMDTSATNYNANTTNDDSSCIYGFTAVTWIATDIIGDTSLIVSYMGTAIDSLSSSGSKIGTPEMAGTPTSLNFLSTGTVYAEFSYDNEIDTVTYSTIGNTLTITDSEGKIRGFDYTVSKNHLVLVSGHTEEGSETVDLGTGPITLDWVGNYLNTMSFTRDTSGILNNNISHKVGNTNHNWFVKPKFNNVLKSIKKQN